MKNQLFKFFLRWLKRDLERQIKVSRWDGELSAKLDAIQILEK